MQKPKPLLVFAHRGEAQSFFKFDNLIAIKTPFENLYEGESYFLLISGEGHHSTLQKLSACCGLLGNKIDRLVNLGVAGSLTEELQIGSLASLRTIFFAHDGKLQFKSFTSSDPMAVLDGVTVTQRILSHEQDTQLKVYGSLVDREAWACGSVAQLFKLPFYSYKYISDRVAENTQEICQRIKETAELYSHELYQFYQGKLAVETPIENSLWTQLEGFYFSQTQKRKFSGMIKSLAIKEPNFSLTNESFQKKLQDIRQNIPRPKLRTNQLLIELENRLNPFRKILQQEVDGTLAPLKMAKFQVSYDKDFESSELKLTANINSKDQIENLIRGLKRFSLAEYKKIFDGEINV